ncbi:unnamed protein product [Cyprideis torosa]|uniref:Uncharacterized protein n=1 Tax=Cyprideis torosa TaxID=163714 RepID=A0A7R8ZNE0_9CRUS|nr:unnamed protein product [Cyprideis torosa]CAG0886123.1 unnamed protein product [Cyprideis torosa]
MIEVALVCPPDQRASVRSPSTPGTYYSLQCSSNESRQRTVFCPVGLCVESCVVECRNGAEIAGSFRRVSLPGSSARSCRELGSHRELWRRGSPLPEDRRRLPRSPRRPAPSLVVFKLLHKNMKHYCAGTLITERFILTAAHCVADKFAPHTVMAIREFSLSGPEGVGEAAHFRPDLIIRHYGYNPDTFHHDIALIRLKTPIRLDQERFVSVACLPDNNVEQFEGKYGIVTGWGRLYEGGPTPDTPHEVVLPIVNNRVCQTLLRQYFVITPGQMCAGFREGGRDACQVELEAETPVRVVHSISCCSTGCDAKMQVSDSVTWCVELGFTTGLSIFDVDDQVVERFGHGQRRQDAC